MSLNGNWIRFKGLADQKGRFTRHYVTINYKGQIHLGRRVHEDLGRPRAATLYYEPGLNRIAIQPADLKDSGVVRVVEKEYGASYVPAIRFVRQNRIHIGGTEAFLNPDINYNGILILDLNETVRVGGTKRKRREAE